MAGPLGIYGALIGHCFTATLSTNVTDRHCFASVYDGAHVRDTHVVTAGGKAVYSGETLYSVGANGLEFTYLNSDGGVGHGLVRAAGQRLAITGSMLPAPGKKAVKIDSVWTLSATGFAAADAGKPAVRYTLER